MTVEQAVAAAAAVFFVGFLMTPVVLRTGAPLLLLFLGLGMLLGEDGPGGVAFDDFVLAHKLGSVALALILFAGGLETHFNQVRNVVGAALSMATLGVCLTAGILGVLVSLLLGLPLAQALLLGAVVGSTDAAATFMLLQQRQLVVPDRTTHTILLESGLNDPIAIFLTMMLVSIVDSGIGTLGWSSLLVFTSQMGFGVLFGTAGGFAIVYLLKRVALLPGMVPVFVLSGGLLVFGATAMVDGSGFLAVYLCGLIIRTHVHRDVEQVVDFHAAMAWISQIALFLMLGLLVTPSDLPSAAGPALVMAAILIFLARPVATMVGLAVFGYPFREKLFISWVGLRGAVPIFLSIIPVISDGPITVSFFEEVFIIVIASLVLQGWTISPVARRLGLEPPSRG